MIPLGILASARHASSGGGWTPADLPGLVGWWDASATGALTESGGLISQWADLSGTGNHMTQATGSAQPSVSTLNGLTAVNLAAGKTMLSTNSTNRNEVQTFGMAAKFTTLSNFTPHVLLASAIRPAYVNSTNWVAFGGAGGSLVGPLRDTNAHRFLTVFDGANSSLTVDGTAYTGTTAFLTSLNAATQFGNTSGAALFGEAVLCTGALGSSDLASLDAYLSAKWGI